MKKLLLIFASILSTGALLAQTDCSDLFMSEYVEGWKNNKSLELYNPTGIPIILDNVYRLIRWSNGNSAADQEIAYVLPLTGIIESFKVMVMIQDTNKPGQDTMVWPALRNKATWLAPYAYATQPPYTQGGNVVFWNGDDAVSLQKKIDNVWTDIDIFGEIGVRPKNWEGDYDPAGAWTDTKPYILGTGRYLTKSKTLIRKHTVKHGVDRLTMIHYGDTLTGGVPNSFNTFLEYDSMPANFFDSLGQHWCDCKTAQAIIHQLSERSVTINPNPIVNYKFEVGSVMAIASVHIYTMIGQAVFSRDFSIRQKEVSITVDPLPAGVYLVKVKHYNNESVIRKIIIQ